MPMRLSQEKRILTEKNMTTVEIILFIAGIIGAIYHGRQRKYYVMCACLVVAIAMFVLLALTVILIMGID